MAAIVLTVLVVAVGAALALTSTPGFCGLCKSHKTYVEKYQKTAHRDANCEQCHTKPGPFFFVVAKLEALQQPIHQLTGDYETPILGTVLNESCRRCHTNDKLYAPGSAHGIRVDHEHLVEAGFLCNRCHSVTAHLTAVPEGSRTYPTMEQCLICHNNKYKAPDGTVATSRCDLCHVKRGYGATPVSHKTPDWSTRHGAVGVLSTCSACHIKPDACSKCHDGILMPHPTNWLYDHGKTAESSGRRSCEQCHEKAYCSTCHKLPMPHPSDFVSSHPQAAARWGASTCFNCHTLENCQACHEQHATGDGARAHSLFEGIRYTPAPRPSPSPSVLGAQ